MFGCLGVTAIFGSSRILMRPGCKRCYLLVVGRVENGRWLLRWWDSDVNRKVFEVFIVVWLTQQQTDIGRADVAVV